MALDPVSSNYSDPFTVDPNTGLTPDEIERRRRFALEMMKEGMTQQPVVGGKWAPLQAFARMLQTGVGAWNDQLATEEENKARTAGMAEGLAGLRSEDTPAPSSNPASPIATDKSPAPPPGVTIDNGGDQPAPSSAPEPQGAAPAPQQSATLNASPVPPQRNFSPIPPQQTASPVPPGALQAQPQQAAQPLPPLNQNTMQSQLAGLSPEDRDYAIRTIYGEAANQSPEGQAAVAQVIKNRLAAGNPDWGNSVQSVVTAPNQFEPWNNPTAKSRMMALSPNSPGYNRLGQMVDGVWNGQTPDNTGGAQYFLNPNIVRARNKGQLPDWAQGQPSAVIGAHSFFAGPQATASAEPMRMGPSDNAQSAAAPAPGPAKKGMTDAELSRVLSNQWVPDWMKQKLVEQYVSPKDPTFQTLKDDLGAEHGYWVDPRKQTVTEAKIPGQHSSALADQWPDLQGQPLLDKLNANNKSEGSIVQMMVEGKMTPPSSFALAKSPLWAQRIAMARRVDPMFDESTWSQRNKERISLTSGQGRKDKQSVNQLLEHMNDVFDAGQKLGNYSSGGIGPGGLIPSGPVNYARSKIQETYQNPDFSKFDVAKKAMMDELANNWKSSGATDAEIKGWSETLSHSASPEQITGVLQEISKLISGRIRPYQDIIETSPFMNDIQFLTPTGKKLLGTLYGETGGDINEPGNPVGASVGGPQPNKQQYDYDPVTKKLVPRQ